MNSEEVTKSSLFKIFCKHSIKAFAVQIAVMLLSMVLVLIPFISVVALPVVSLVTFLYLPTMGLVRLLNLFPHSDGLEMWVVGWLLGVILYSLAWASIKTWMGRKKLGTYNAASNHSLNRSAR